jgi:hypothetical protein
MYKWEMTDKDVGNNGRQGRAEVNERPFSQIAVCNMCGTEI